MFEAPHQCVVPVVEPVPSRIAPVQRHIPVVGSSCQGIPLVFETASFAEWPPRLPLDSFVLLFYLFEQTFSTPLGMAVLVLMVALYPVSWQEGC
jgi:hypothetical protein